MPFWIAAAFLTFLACLPVLVPLARRGRATVPDDAAFDMAVYRDQLAELERDAARGAISGAEAAEARAEIGRRILKASATIEARPDRDSGRGFSRAGRVVASLAVLAIPLTSWGIYAATGSPGLPAQPLSARLERSPAESSIVELVARAERHLAANPEDGRGWEVIAPIYYRIGRHQDAVAAYENTVRLLGSTAAREIALGEAVASAAGGAITAQARAAFERALALEPKNPKARFLAAAALAHAGDNAGAAAAFRALLDDLPDASPWRPTIARAISDLGAPGSAPGPMAEDVEAAGLISDKERAGMIGDMVEGLDRRLRENPDDPEGWQRLVRSYLVLDRADDAADALKRGIEALGTTSAAAAQLQAFAATLGLRAKE